MTAIVTGTDVAGLTGITPSDAQILQAQGVISLKCGFDLSDSGIFTDGTNALVPFERDRRLLRQAVCYQAAWITAHPDAFTASDVTQYTADGTSAVFTPTGTTLAPLAKMCLRRLSWQGTRSTHIDHAPAYAPRDHRGDSMLRQTPEYSEYIDSETGRQGEVYDTQGETGWMPA